VKLAIRRDRERWSYASLVRPYTRCQVDVGGQPQVRFQ